MGAQAFAQFGLDHLARRATSGRDTRRRFRCATWPRIRTGTTLARLFRRPWAEIADLAAERAPGYGSCALPKLLAICHR